MEASEKDRVRIYLMMNYFRESLEIQSSLISLSNKSGAEKILYCIVLNFGLQESEVVRILNSSKEELVEYLLDNKLVRITAEYRLKQLEGSV